MPMKIYSPKLYNPVLSNLIYVIQQHTWPQLHVGERYQTLYKAIFHATHLEFATAKQIT